MIEKSEKRHVSRKEDNDNDHAEPDADVEDDQDEMFLKNATNVTEEEFKSEQLQALKRSLKPNFQVYMCMQINIDLSAITIPGLHLNLGLLGGVSLDFHNGCWSFSLEAALGFDWGFKIYGFGLGIGASMTGSFDLSEVPAQRVLGDPEALHKDASVYAPEGADLRRCHTRNPWMVVQAWIEQKWRNIYRSKKVQTQMAETLKNESWTKSEKDYMNSYGYLLNGSFEALGVASPYVMQSDLSFEASQVQNQAMELSWFSLLPATSNATNLTDNVTEEEIDGDPDNALPGSTLIELPWDVSPAAFTKFTAAVSNASVAPRLSAPAVAMTKALRGLIAELPAYAGQVLERLTDSSDVYTGTDASKTVMGVERTAGLRLKESTGRFWARWPSEERHSSLCEAGGGRNSSGDCSTTPIGVSKRKDGSDQRVLNFAKAMRHSKHSASPAFWKGCTVADGVVFEQLACTCSR
ncbi:unnamed protein product [Prorocentrum cordatum]|uniref:Uncharacterized protein n=1 Tax=Prorocentrum cordatum TaxID=2364126 RepID=A0ABN9WIL1_9DINO|nr:unnamed protein product [Polarella glacialis]